MHDHIDVTYAASTRVQFRLTHWRPLWSTRHIAPGVRHTATCFYIHTSDRNLTGEHVKAICWITREAGSKGRDGRLLAVI